MKTSFKLLMLSLLIFSLSSTAKTTKKNSLKTAEATALNTFISLTQNQNSIRKQFIKVAILLDTSNSMDGLIDQAKAQLWEVVNELSYARCGSNLPSLEISIYEYGNNSLNADEGYIRQVLQFSDDLDEISKQLFSLTTNGGNEYCGQAIQTSLNQLKWGSNPDDLKLIFIAGNEPFSQGKIPYADAAANAKEKDISINTIFCGDYNQGVSSYWKDGADLTNGNYMAINANKATVHVASPYDDRILQLNIRLNGTYVSYGSSGRAKLESQKDQDNNALGYSAANAVSRTISKSSHLYKNSSWDLVDAEESENFEYDSLKPADLPKELKGKSTPEIKKYLETKRKERETIQNEIQELNAQRKAYVSKQKPDTNGLENAMTEAIKTQAKRKNYTWK
ncbi:VWA domain-containing protein [Flavobacteriaceae bacterium]|nr:VWA domain-containing protein [Flavobacteriaceae bacterium]